MDVKKENAVDVSNRESEDDAPQGRNRRSGGKRVSTITRTTQEGEALLKGLGHEESGSVEVENRRRTRSSTRGVPPTPPPPVKREKKTPPSGGRGSRRGRPKREENQEEKPKEDGSEQETTNDAANDKSGGKPGAEEMEEKDKNTEGGDLEKKMEVDEDKATPAAADQDSSSSQTQKSESASDGPEGAVPVTENAENAEAKTPDGNHEEADKHPSPAKETADASERPGSVAENEVNEDKAPSSEDKPAPVPTIPAPATTAVVTPTADGSSGDPKKPAISVIPPTIENNKVTVPTTTVTGLTEEGKPAAAE